MKDSTQQQWSNPARTGQCFNLCVYHPGFPCTLDYRKQGTRRTRQCSCTLKLLVLTSSSQLRAAFDRVYSGAPKGSIGKAALKALAVNQVRKRSLWECPECGYCYQLYIILGDRPRLRARSSSHPTVRGGIRVQVESNMQLVELVKHVPPCAQRLSGLLIERLQLLHRSQ